MYKRQILQWVTFRLDNESYGINVMQVQEVLRYTEIAPVPGAPSYVPVSYTHRFCGVWVKKKKGGGGGGGG
ncbi:chemotaxis protein CheW, partial [Pseudomonas sp. CCC3.2]|nr:chemotaxis protein CheW [Pseudomonas sp. CCC3.2]